MMLTSSSLSPLFEPCQGYPQCDEESVNLTSDSPPFLLDHVTTSVHNLECYVRNLHIVASKRLRNLLLYYQDKYDNFYHSDELNLSRKPVSYHGYDQGFNMHNKRGIKSDSPSLIIHLNAMRLSFLMGDGLFFSELCKRWYKELRTKDGALMMTTSSTPNIHTWDDNDNDCHGVIQDGRNSGIGATYYHQQIMNEQPQGWFHDNIMAPS
eukprot:6246980-Ditylum_brightwellii.AAC.1